MRKLIGLIVILAVAVAAFGWYQGWFRVSAEKEGDTTDINIQIDTNRAKEDLESAAEKAKRKGEEIVDKAKDAVDEQAEKLKDE